MPLSCSGPTQSHARTPYAPQTTKGSGADLVIVDEAAYVNKDLFFETIVPLLEMKSCSLICISTPLDELNWFSTLLDMTDIDGLPFFKVIRLDTICNKCKLLSRKEMDKCTHKTDVLPSWKSGPRHERNKRLYEMDDLGRGLRENAGIVTGADNTVFDRDVVKQFFEHDTMQRFIPDSDAPPRCVYIMVDPDADGDSELALVSGFVTNTQPNAPKGMFVVRRCPITFTYYTTCSTYPCCQLTSCPSAAG